MTSLFEALERSSGMTLSCVDLVLSDIGEKCSATQGGPSLLNNSLKGLILRQEIEGRDERGRQIGLQYYERRTL